jgi:RND superfamily putative drug exporter
VAAAQTAPQAVSPNRGVQLVTVALQGTPQDEAVVAALGQVRQRSAQALEGSGLRIGWTGDVALFADSEEAFTDAERIVGIVTLVLIVGLQLLIFRSPIAALTLIPALLALTGPRVFWPSRSWQRTPGAPVFTRLGGLVARRPVLVALASGAVVVALAAGTLGFRQNYDFVSQLPSDTESRKAFADLQSGFPAGALNPTQVYVRGDQPLDTADLARLGASLQQVPGVGQVQPPQLSPDRRVGQVDLLLRMNPSSAEALDPVGPLRDAAHAAAPPGTTVLAGGTTPATADLRQATGRDLRVIFPVAGVLIALVLALLLRSLVAPIYLMLAVMGGYAASLGRRCSSSRAWAASPGPSPTWPSSTPGRRWCRPG